MNKLLLSKKRFKRINAYSFVIMFLFVNQAAVHFIPGGQVAQWSPPQTIPLYQLETIPPVLVADQNRTVHAFSSQWVGDNFAVVYNNWSLSQGWTKPVDIILSPIKEARLTDVLLDQNGMFHAVFFGGDNTAANIYYSKAPADSAGDARAWSVPALVGEYANDPENAAIIEDDYGTLYVVYSGQGWGDGLYVVNSRDGGENWSNSTPIFFTQSDEPNISLLDFVKSTSGGLHAIWGVYNKGGQGRGIFYARTKDGEEWSTPFLLADAQEDLGTQTPTIIEYKKVLIALYNTQARISMRQSMDNGETWQNPVEIFPRHTGVNGSLSLVIDSNHDLHLFFGQRISGSIDIHGMWHSVYENNRWTEPIAIVKGPRILDEQGLTGFDPYDARAVVSQGNTILVTWRTDPGEIKENGVWFSYTTIDAPELPLSTPPSIVKDTTTPIATDLVIPTISLNTMNVSSDKVLQVGIPVVWLVTGVVFFVSILVIIYAIFKRNR